MIPSAAYAAHSTRRDQNARIGIAGRNAEGAPKEGEEEEEEERRSREPLRLREPKKYTRGFRGISYVI